MQRCHQRRGNAHHASARPRRVGLAGAVILSALWISAPALAQPQLGAAHSEIEARARGEGLRAKPVAVFGSDDRTALPARFNKLQDSLGILFNVRGRTVCTAFCVGDDVIATASHCLFRTVGEQAQRLSDFWFARNYDTARDYARIAGYNSGAASQNVLAGDRRLKVQPPIDATSDWALVRLSRPICSKTALLVAPVSSDELIRRSKAKQVFQISYHRDFPQWKLAYSKPCDVARDYPGAAWSTVSQDFSNPEPLILHTCDTGGASSGSPLLMETPEGPRVVGINVGTYIQSRIAPPTEHTGSRTQTETVANTAVSAGVFADKIAPFQSASILFSTPTIKDLQERLKQRQHYAGEIDGTYGPTLKTAIEDFEKAQNLKPLGLATDAVLKQLKDLPSGSQLPAAARGVKIP
jgi:Putative peptidoglycan binding domain/Trypsin-like peptidase domain